MGAFISGDFTRVRWRLIDSAVMAALSTPELTALVADALLDGVQDAWGLAPDCAPQLIGDGVASEADNELNMPTEPEPQWESGPPEQGEWLVCIQHAAHCWATVDGVDELLPEEIAIDRFAVRLPATTSLVLCQPRRGDQPFRLVYPPSPERERQAALGRDGVTLPVGPFRAEKGGLSFASPVYRYGLLRHGVMRWLDLPPGKRVHPARPATDAFRAKLVELKANLAGRGVFYMDAPDEKYHHRHSFEDAWDHIPSEFGAETPPVAYSVSGEHDNEDKEDRAHALYIPDGDEVLRFDEERIAFCTLLSEMDITEVDIIYVGGRAAGVTRSQRWTGWTIAAAAKAVGLLVAWGGSPGSSISVAMPSTWLGGAPELLPPSSAEVSDRAARIAPVVTHVARAGLGSAAADALAEEMERRLDLILQLREALDQANRNDWFAAFETSAAVQACAPTPLYLRTGMSADAGATLAAVSDPFEVKVGFHLCRLAAEQNGTAEAERALTTVRDAWNTYREPKWWEESIERWVRDELEPVLACGDVEADTETDQPAPPVPATLEKLVGHGDAVAFATAWAEAEPATRDTEGVQLLRRAVAGERYDIAEFLLNDDVPLDRCSEMVSTAFGSWGGGTALGAAIETGSLSAVRWCVERGANPEAAQMSRGQTCDGEEVDWPTPAVVLAAKHARADILAYLLAIGGDAVSPIGNGITPLTAAAFGGSTECVEMLLVAGADAAQQAAEPWVTGGPETLTPLLYACDQGHDAVVCLLLARGADPRTPRCDGEFALQLAMQGCALSTIEALLASGADGAAVNRDGLSVLHTAVLKRRADVLPLLLAAGAPVDLPAGERVAFLSDLQPGWTTLSIAAAQGDGRSIAMLLEAGADPLAVDGEERTALDLARLAADPSAVDQPYDAVILMLEEAEQRAWLGAT